MIEFYKNDDAMAIRTDAASDTEFLDGCAKAMAEMIEQQAQGGDWEYALGFWLPQIVDISCSLKGYKSDVVTRTVRSAGSSHFIQSTAVAILNDRKEVTINTPEVGASTAEGK
jgi:hypothetical protein